MKGNMTSSNDQIGYLLPDNTGTPDPFGSDNPQTRDSFGQLQLIEAWYFCILASLSLRGSVLVDRLVNHDSDCELRPLHWYGLRLTTLRLISSLFRCAQTLYGAAMTVMQNILHTRRMVGVEQE